MNSCMAKGSLILACLVLLAACPAYAQLGLPGVERALFIKLAPLHPGPGDVVHLSIHSSILDLTEAEVLWHVNQKTVAAGVEVDAIDVTMGALGTATDLEVFVVTSDGTGASATAAIIPTELDLLVDSDSYVPPFFRGRPSASAGTNLYLQAIPQFKRPEGPPVLNSEIIYTWRQNGEVIGDISGRGKSTARIPARHLFGTEKISVEARTSDGLLSNESSFSFNPVEPVLTLYQNHPLYGILYHQALAPATFVPETEMTFVAVPYFAGVVNENDRALVFDWRVNGKAIAQSQTNPSTLTINAANSSGVALIELVLTHATNFYMDAKGLWNITFSTSAAEGQFGAFGQQL
jgi:hypothetical protein